MWSVSKESLSPTYTNLKNANACRTMQDESEVIQTVEVVTASALQL